MGRAERSASGHPIEIELPRREDRIRRDPDPDSCRSATPASAQQTYSLTGKFARSNGLFVHIPQIGNAGGNCPSIVQGYRSTITMVPAKTTPAITRTRIAAPRGCVSGMGQIQTIMGAGGVGAAFYMPVNAFQRPLPGMTLALSIPNVPNLVQLATSFAVSGPPKTVGTGVDAPGGTMIVRLPSTPMGVPQNLAMFRYFHKSAWKGQTGRAGSMFTWCIGNPGCSNVVEGSPVIVEYTPGPNKFGGTMSHLITAGPNKSSLAFATGGSVEFLGLQGMGVQPTGRGYADLLTDTIRAGPVWAMYKLGNVYVPQIMGSRS